jgi:hypothetical protein
LAEDLAAIVLHWALQANPYEEQNNYEEGFHSVDGSGYCGFAERARFCQASQEVEGRCHYDPDQQGPHEARQKEGSHSRSKTRPAGNRTVHATVVPPSNRNRSFAARSAPAQYTGALLFPWEEESVS